MLFTSLLSHYQDAWNKTQGIIVILTFLVITHSVITAPRFSQGIQLVKAILHQFLRHLRSHLSLNKIRLTLKGERGRSFSFDHTLFGDTMTKIGEIQQF